MKKVRLLLLAAGLLLSGLCGGLGVWRFLRMTRPPAQVWSMVVRQVPIAELATREIRWQVLIHEKDAFPAREYLMLRTATVKAGFDLSKLDPGRDVAFDPRNKVVTINLPPPQVLSVTWGEPRIPFERHSLAAAALHKSGDELRRREALFRQGLLADLEREDLLSFSSMIEGFRRYVAPFFAREGWQVKCVESAPVKFRSAVKAWFEQNGLAQ